MARARRRTVAVKDKLKEKVAARHRQTLGAEGKLKAIPAPATASATTQTKPPTPASTSVEVPAVAPEQETEEASKELVSRGQRRRRAKREGFLRKFEFVNASQKEDRAREGGALGSLDGLGEAAERALEEGNRPRRKTMVMGRQPRPLARKKQTLAIEREIAQFQQVLKVEAFQKDPLAALEQHVRNSLKKQKEDFKAKEARACGRGRKRRKFRDGKGKRRAGAVSGTQEAGARKGVIKSSLKQRSKGVATATKKMEES